jgi:hypothetical protein
MDPASTNTLVAQHVVPLEDLVQHDPIDEATEPDAHQEPASAGV